MFRVKCHGEYYCRENGITTEKPYKVEVTVNVPFYEIITNEKKGTTQIIGNFSRVAGMVVDPRVAKSNHSLVVKEIKKTDPNCITIVDCHRETAVWEGSSEDAQNYLDDKRKFIDEKYLMLKVGQKNMLTVEQRAEQKQESANIEFEKTFIQDKVLPKKKARKAEASA